MRYPERESAAFRSTVPARGFSRQPGFNRQGRRSVDPGRSDGAHLKPDVFSRRTPAAHGSTFWSLTERDRVGGESRLLMESLRLERTTLSTADL